ncbi:RNA-directed DNA polymerase, eukaryota [Tanacetum coccineum]|uniref:RNA-directed DNA polymerase, eukaryota n=1 Tax=Tanacetum coccineum TaxID=301880 RepID=A0ABQ5B4K3_9ASTR
MHFPVKWCGWIRACLHSARASVLVNGSPSNEFRIHRGLRQGDPLSHFLFIIAMDGLHIVMEDAKAAGLFHGLKLDNNDLHLSHLLYADDVIFMGEWSLSNVRVIKNIYGSQGGFDKDHLRVTGPQPWARLLSLLSRLKAKNVIHQDTIQRKFGDETSTKLWHDCWLNGITLSSQYPRLYSLENYKDCFVSDKWNSGDGWIWSWRMHLRGGMEQSQFQDLMERLQSFSCSSNVDSWIWNPDPSGDFTVKYTRRWLDDIILPTNLMVTRWNPLVPKKVNIFCWRMFLNRIPTRLLLDSRGIDIPNVLCPICGIDQEDITHLFLKCEVTSEIWRAIFTWLGFVPPDIGSIKDLFLWIDNNHMVAKKKKGFEAIYQCCDDLERHVSHDEIRFGSVGSVEHEVEHSLNRARSLRVGTLSFIALIPKSLDA